MLLIFLKLKKLCGPHRKSQEQRREVLRALPSSAQWWHFTQPSAAVRLGSWRVGADRLAAAPWDFTRVRLRSLPKSPPPPAATGLFPSVVSSFGTVRECDIMCHLQGWRFLLRASELCAPAAHLPALSMPGNWKWGVVLPHLPSRLQQSQSAFLLHHST